MAIRVEEYIREGASNPYKQWFDSLSAQAAAKVTVANFEWRWAIRRASSGLTAWVNASSTGVQVIGSNSPRMVTLSLSCSVVAPNAASNTTSTKPRHCWLSTRLVKRRSPPIQAASTRGNRMVLTRNFKETVIQRVQSDASFAQALLDEAATLFLNGEPETSRLILRDLVNATIGFEQLATLTAKPSKSLHRMLSPTGNPSMDNLAAIFRAVGERLQVSLSAHSVAT